MVLVFLGVGLYFFKDDIAQMLGPQIILGTCYESLPNPCFVCEDLVKAARSEYPCSDSQVNLCWSQIALSEKDRLVHKDAYVWPVDRSTMTLTRSMLITNSPIECSGLPSVTTTTLYGQECIDYDGNNAYVKSQVSFRGSSLEYQDKCLDTISVREWICSSGLPNAVSINCRSLGGLESTCVDGKCVGGSITTTTTTTQPPQCPPGYYFNNGLCVQLPTTTLPTVTTLPSGGCPTGFYLSNGLCIQENVDEEDSCAFYQKEVNGKCEIDNLWIIGGIAVLLLFFMMAMKKK